MRRYHENLVFIDHQTNNQHPSLFCSDAIYISKETSEVLHLIDNDTVNGAL